MRWWAARSGQLATTGPLFLAAPEPGPFSPHFSTLQHGPPQHPVSPVLTGYAHASLQSQIVTPSLPPPPPAVSAPLSLSCSSSVDSGASHFSVSLSFRIWKTGRDGTVGPGSTRHDMVLNSVTRGQVTQCGGALLNRTEQWMSYRKHHTPQAPCASSELSAEKHHVDGS